jgi:hypothetical protein
MRIILSALLYGACSLHCLVGGTVTVTDIDLASFTSGPTEGVQLVGDGSGGPLGNFVSTAGDFDGDGLMDIVIGAYHNTVLGRNLAGTVYVMFGSTTLGADGMVDMATFQSGSDGFRIIGAAAGDAFGETVAGGGDVNGDGYDDVLAGSQHHNPGGRSEAGAVWVIFGRPRESTFTDIDLASLSADLGIKIYGGYLQSWMFTCAYIGDMNGDGFDDIAIGASGSVGIPTKSGGWYVIFGKSSMSDFDVRGLSAAATDGFIIAGTESQAYPGRYVGSAGDFNGDGYSDALVSSIPSGYVMVVFGHNDTLDFPALTASSTFSQSVYGGRSGLGFSIVGIGEQQGRSGDINQDGIDDILVFSRDYGATSAIFGYRDGPYPDVYLPSWTYDAAIAFTITREGTDVAVGIYGGDLNGDGIGDIYVTVPFAQSDASRSSAGIGYVLFSHGSATNYTDVDLTAFNTSVSTGYRILGAHEYDAGGNVVQRVNGAALGDVNGDGVDDVAWSAPGFDYSDRTDCGSVYILLSPILTSLRPTVTPTAAPGTRRPTAAPTSRPPTAAPSSRPPTTAPSFKPPTAAPSVRPPTAKPSIAKPSAGPTTTVAPSAAPTPKPSAAPTVPLTAGPIADPSAAPSADPSAAPTAVPTAAPSGVPITEPSADPSATPSAAPTAMPTAAPTVEPSADPSAAPSAVLTATPSGAPTVEPSADPSAAPSAVSTVVPAAAPTAVPSQPIAQPALPGQLSLDALSSYPTYRPRNGFAFAAVDTAGRAYAWGEGQHGGDSSAVQGSLLSDVMSVIPARFAFAALKSNGSVVPWGAQMNSESLAAYASIPYTVATLIANEAAFAGIDAATGRVVAFGSKHHGGNVLDNRYCSGSSAQLSAGVRNITASTGAFVALKVDGTLHAWGNRFSGADVAQSFLATLSGAKAVVATTGAFAVLLGDYRVTAWGDKMVGGDSSAVANQLHDVVHVTASRLCFVAYKQDSGVVVWGYGKYGGDTSSVAAQLASQVIYVTHTFTAMAAVKADGSVVTWGTEGNGGDSSAVSGLGGLTDVVRVYGNAGAFAALTATGRVVAWGRAANGGSIPGNKMSALSANVTAIYHTDRAFAALKDDGSLVVWGQAGNGGSPGATVGALLTSGVHTVCANDVAFSAIKMDGSVVAWGHDVSVPVDGVQFTSAALQLPVKCA